MRLYLNVSVNKKTIPFNYQQHLTAAIHKWIGEDNKYHGSLSLFSFSWLQNVNTNKTGIKLTQNSHFFISAFNNFLIKRILKGIIQDPSFCFKSYITDVQILENPRFSNNETFLVASPVFIKRRFENKEKHITYDNARSSEFLTETLKKKLTAAKLPSKNVSVEFNVMHANPCTKVIYYNDVGNKVNICPVTVKGTPEQIAFAWNVGVGNCTGIGFGALK